ncbi:prolyl 4-hydroxylase subunit alpha-2 [Folsomia candida]|nr:prolyl 4-hydroxylase subunit alpha-2 [Folsomia candida]
METNCVLSPQDLVKLGNVAFSDESYAQAVDAFVAAKSNMRNGSLLERAIKYHDIKLDKIKSLISYNDIHVDSGLLLFDAFLHNMTHPNFINRIPLKLETMFPDPPADTDVCGGIKYEAIQNGYIFEKLCRGEDVKTRKDKMHLKCYYSSKSHPEFILKPLKIEVHNKNPLLIQYHNILSEQDMQQYRDQVNKDMKISKTTPSIRSQENKKTPRISRQRTSSGGWIQDSSSKTFPTFNKLLHKIGRILQVDISKETGSEMMQIAAYSPGAHYAPHTDAIFEYKAEERLEPFDLLSGDRIMTFMIYLSDVEEGGTAFPILKTLVHPSKGSALMWYNVQPDVETIDRRTLHGGCSVLYGVKWIANKWIRSKDQFQTLKCPASKQFMESWPLEMHIDME